MKYLFIGEQRSELAIKKGVTWIDGKLAAKQLFDCLNTIGINPKDNVYINYFETPDIITQLKKYKRNGFIIVAMGNKVAKQLKLNNIYHLKIVHPAARGKIRNKANYSNHLKSILLS